jgi:predicted nucleic acid-binding protein
VASLVDTNILVYCYDLSDPRKRALAREILRQGAAAGTLRIPHQAMVEFVNAVTRGRSGGPLLAREEAWRQAEDFLNEFEILYPNEKLFRTAMRGMAVYGFSWYDAHLWAYAEHFDVTELLSEDFEHGRKYGGVTVRNPFLGSRLA